MSPRRQCSNKQPHNPHIWRGLNTRHDGYQCLGVAISLGRDELIGIAFALREYAGERQESSKKWTPREARLVEWAIALEGLSKQATILCGGDDCPRCGIQSCAVTEEE